VLGSKAEMDLIFTLLPLVIRDPNMAVDPEAIHPGRLKKGNPVRFDLLTGFLWEIQRGEL